MTTPFQEALLKQNQNSTVEQKPTDTSASKKSTTTTLSPFQQAFDIYKNNPKLSSALTDASASKKASDEANSPMGFAKNFAKELLPNLWSTLGDVVKMPYEMIKGEFAPSEQTKAEEKLILPEPKTTYEKIAWALPNTLYKIPFRFFQPLFQPYADTLSQSIVSQEFAPQVASGKMSVKDFQDAFPAIQKTDLQAIGESIQTGLAIYAPSFFGEQAKGMISLPLKKALFQGFGKSIPLGLAFGTAQALSSGSTDPAEITKMVTTSAVGMGLIGAIVSGAIPLKDSFAKQTLGAIKQEHNLPTNAEEYIYNDKKTISFTPPKTQSESTVLPGYKEPTQTGLSKDDIARFKKQGFDDETIAKMNEAAKTQIPKTKETPVAPDTTGKEQPVAPVADGGEEQPIKPFGTGEVKTSKTSEKLGGDLTYQSGEDITRQKFAEEAVNTDYKQAVESAMGRKPLPENVQPGDMLAAVRKAAQEKGDIQTEIDLSDSPLISTGTAAGQIVQSFASIDPTDAVGHMQDISESKKANLLKDTGEKSVPKAKEKLLNKFLDDITCK